MQAKCRPNMVAQLRLRIQSDQCNRTKTATIHNKTNMTITAIIAIMGIMEYR